MNKFFYLRLAVNNIRKNGQTYIPYVLTCIGTIMMFYNMCFLAVVKDIGYISDSQSLRIILRFGATVIGIFSVIFLFYTNSFLIKRRKKEFGLFNILGMEKKHIAKLMFFETLFIGFISLAAGILAGILLSKLMILLLFKIIAFKVTFGFEIPISAIVATVALFCGIFLLNLIYNICQVHLSKPIELLKGGNVGEKEPKTKWIMASIGAICLGIGYYIALTTESPLTALNIFFVAVILVMIGTYCLFTAGSIAVLKMLRKNKKYYYKLQHFISVSGMIYRMKQNAVGLANICILSTMVLVMVSGTLSLYLGTEDALKKYYPGQIVLQAEFDGETEDRFNKEVFIKKVEEIISSDEGKITDLDEYTYLAFSVGKGNGFFDTEIDRSFNAEFIQLCFITEADYMKLTGREVKLKDNEILLYDSAKENRDNILIKAGDYSFDFTVAGHLDSFPPVGDLAIYITDISYVVVKDEQVLSALYKGQKSAYNDRASDVKWVAEIDTDLKEDVQIACAREIKGLFSEGGIRGYRSFQVNTRAEGSTAIYAINGGFLFLGIFLGLLFIMATVLIIYYKQISESYEDKGRFEIMQKVGLPKKEIKRSIHAQILIVFFAPLVVAAIHVAFDFKLMIKLLSLFALKNIRLTMICTAGTLLGFAVMYGIVYALTARTYYKIVSAE